MKIYEIKYRMKQSKNRVYTIKVRAMDEEHARKIAYSKIDNRFYELI